MVVEAQTVLDELHDRAIRTMDAEGSFNRRVHRDTTELANGGEREDVGQRVGIVPDSPKILDVANKRRNLVAAIRVNLQMTVAAPDVSEEIRVFENRNSQLAVEEYPGRWDELVTRGQLSEGEIRNRVRVVSGNDGLGVRVLEKRHGGSGFSLEESGVGTVRALVGVMSFMLATETSDVSVRDAVSACNHFASLHKTHAVFLFDCRLLLPRENWFSRSAQRVPKRRQSARLRKARARVRSRAILRRFVALSALAETAAVASSKPGSLPMAPP